MKIEIRNMDTFSLIKGFLELYHDNCSAQTYDETEQLLEQMKNVPSTDAKGNFTEDPLELCKMYWDDLAKAAIPQFEEEIKYNKDLAGTVANFWNNIGEAMGLVCYSGFKLKEALDRAVLPKDWVDVCIKYYEENVANS